MNKEEAMKYCLSSPGAELTFPFDQVTEVFKVGGKMFALIANGDDPVRLNLKCDPLLSPDLREQYPAIIPGYHMNKTHWNSLILDGTLDEDMIKGLIEHSYELVLSSLPKKVQSEINKK